MIHLFYFITPITGLQRFPRSQIDEGFMGTSGVQKSKMTTQN